MALKSSCASVILPWNIELFSETYFLNVDIPTYRMNLDSFQALNFVTETYEAFKYIGKAK